MSYITDGAMKRITEAFGQRLQGSGITRIQWIALYYIHDHEKISQRQLAQLMSITDSSAGRLLDRLQRDGHVKRIASETDRRVTLVELTEEGRETIEELLPLGIEFQYKLMDGIDEQELEIFQNVLEKMVRNASNEGLE